jgi:hypothetical protein
MFGVGIERCFISRFTIEKIEDDHDFVEDEDEDEMKAMILMSGNCCEMTLEVLNAR